MDRLEEFIRNKRDSMDPHSPSPDVWKRVSKEIRPARSVKRWLAAAASVAVLITISLVFYQAGKNSVNQKLAETANRELPARLQLREAEAYYTGQINALFNEAEPMLTSNPELKEELNSDLAQIDSIYSDLKKDLKDNVANQEVVEALIRNYTIKIAILKDMLAVLRENDRNEKSKSHEL
jgi:hypothetical protein